jgi:hypothetical protein
MPAARQFALFRNAPGKEVIMELKTKRWQDWVNLLLGVWLFASPWLMNYAAEPPRASWNAHILGAVIAVIALAVMYAPRAWEEVVNFVLGAWTLISPWALGFANNKEVMLNTAIVGAIVAVLALWAAIKDKNTNGLWNTNRTA